MSAPRKIAFTTLGSSGTGKKQKPNRNALRLEVNLIEPSKEECTEVSYEDLVYNILKKKGNHEKAVNGGSGLDPYASDDEQQLKELAKKFETKYGGPGAAKKKVRRKNEFVDIGAGYDETDPFIDNTEAYDEYVPANVTTAYGGFYINCGDLEFKAVEFSESESSSEESTTEASGTESSSGGSDSSSEEETTEKEKDGGAKVRKRLRVSSSEGSDSSRAATPDGAAIEKKKDKVEIKKKKIEEVKKQNGTVEKPLKLLKSDSEKAKQVEVPKPKPEAELQPKKQSSGLDSVFDTIESVVKGRDSKNEPKTVKQTNVQKPNEPKPPPASSKPAVSSPETKSTTQVVKLPSQSAQKPSTLKSDSPKLKTVKVAENGTQVARVESGGLQSSEVSGSKVEGLVPPVKKADSQKSPSDESESESESSSSGMESESEKDQSDAEEAAQSQGGESNPSNVKLPENLPFELVSVINALREKAEEAKGVKSKFFTEEVNSFLFRIELYSKQLRCGVRQDMYDYLTSFLPCKKLTLLKRARTSLADHLANRKNILLSKLTTVVERSLPPFLEKYGTDLSSLGGNDHLVVFKSYIAAQEEARNLLSKIVFLKSHHFNIIRSRKDSPREAILSFLQNEVSLIFPENFMSSEVLYRALESSHAIATSEKKMTVKEKKINSLRLLSLLIKPTKPPKTTSPVPAKKPRPPPPKPTTHPKPVETQKESKLAPNWEVAKEIELKILAEKDFRSEGVKSLSVEHIIKGVEKPKEEKGEATKRPRSDSPEVRKSQSEAKRQNVSSTESTKPKCSSPLQRPENTFRGSPEKVSPKSHRPLSASPTTVRNLGVSPKSFERNPTPTPVESYRASVVSVENMSEIARQSKPKSPKPKILKPPKEKKEVPVVPEPRQPPKPTFELNTESAKAVESLFAFMSPKYEGDLVQSPEDPPADIPEPTNDKNAKFESISPPETQNSPKAEKDQPDLSWVYAEMSQISQKATPAEPERHDEKVEDQKLHDSFGKMFELTENVIRGTKAPKGNERSQNGNYSDSFEKFLKVRSPVDMTQELQDLSSFASKKHKAMKAQKQAAPATPVLPGDKVFLDFLKSHSHTSTLPAPSDLPSPNSRGETSRFTNELSPSSARMGSSRGIPSYPASQYFKQKEPSLPGYYQGVDDFQRSAREQESWGETIRRQESASSFQRSYSAVASAVDKSNMPIQLSRSQSQMYSPEVHQNPLNYSRSPVGSSMMSGYQPLQGFTSSRGYSGIDELSVQQAMSQAQASREALASQLLYEQQKQQQQRVAQYKEASRSSHSGSTNFHNSHR